MAKKFFAVIPPIVLTVIGLSTIINGVEYGQKYTHDLLFKYNSSVDTAKYNIVLEQSIINYRFLGAILAFSGAVLSVIIINKCLNLYVFNKDND